MVELRLLLFGAVIFILFIYLFSFERVVLVCPLCRALGPRNRSKVEPILDESGRNDD